MVGRQAVSSDREHGERSPAVSLRALMTPRADADIDAQVMWLARQSTDVASQFFDAVRSTIEEIVTNPESGTTWESDDLMEAVSSVQYRKVHRFPKHLVFYATRPDHIRILRVLHGARNITASMTQDD